MSLALVAGPASGAPRAACQLVTDPEGDGGMWGQVPPGTPAYPTSLDILSADIATNAKQFTAVIRVSQLQSFEQGSPTGIGFAIHVTVNKQRFRLAASRNPGSDPVFTMEGRIEYVGDENNGGATYGLIGLIDGIFDEDASEIRMTAPMKNFTPKVQRGARFNDLRLWSYYEAGYASDTENRRPWGGANHSADRAESKATYAAGAPSCVKVGY
ncbi:MAG TPA: hypothetical protein VNA14_05900 [Mycobacteriales bacterium]|nr:hypothetical protein [Mycobacteriales bacterium]